MPCASQQNLLAKQGTKPPPSGQEEGHGEVLQILQVALNSDVPLHPAEIHTQGQLLVLHSDQERPGLTDQAATPSWRLELQQRL